MCRMTIFALGIMPYISASIILQLMTAVSALEQLSKEGEGPAEDHPVHSLRDRLLALVQGLFISLGVENQPRRAAW